MAKFLTTKGISGELENLIKKSEKFILMASFNVKISDSYLNRLKSASERGVKIRILHGAQIDSSTEAKLKKMKNVEIQKLENLHAKLFLNEKTCIVGSMNLSEASERNENHECAIFIDKNEDGPLYRDSYDEYVQFMKLTSGVVSKKKPKEITPKKVTPKKLVANDGFCIRCKKKVPFKEERPYCKTCFSSWAEWQNPNYVEEFCHRCGKRTDSTIKSAFCVKCTWKEAVPIFEKWF